ncbi:phage major capsid protein [Reinekea sp.]|jgi:HK97 family phage major capsid protein|uniref:phage major capsid protein n=1 Tax=Reinekea sp. TaxID=1970455 RepID=UPI003989C057
MKSIQQLREQRAAKAKELRQLVEKTEVWKDEHQTQYDALEQEISSIDAQTDRFQKVMDVEAAEKNNIQDRANSEGISNDQAEFKQSQEKAIFSAWLRGGRDGLSNEQLQYVGARHRELQNAMGTGTGADGGYLAPNDYARTVISALKEYGGMREVATVIQTERGTELPYPTSNSTSDKGELVPESQRVSKSDPTFGTKSLFAYKFSSKVITVPIELLQDSVIDLEAFIRNQIVEHLGRSTNEFYTVGSGVAQPEGIVTASAAGKIGSTGQVSTVSTDDLLDLKHAVDPAYRKAGKARWMFHDQTLKALKKLKDPSTSKPIWMPGYDMGEPDLIDGNPYTINQDMPEMAASAKSILYGDFSKYIIRDVMQMVLLRFDDSAYMEYGQVGFLAFMRSGGNNMDVGGAVKHYQNSAT